MLSYVRLSQDRKSRLRPAARPHPTTPSPGSSDADAREHRSSLYCALSYGGWMLASAESHPGTVDERQIARNVQALKNRLRGRGKARAAGRGRVRGDPGSDRDSHPNSEYAHLLKALFSLSYLARTYSARTLPRSVGRKARFSASGTRHHLASLKWPLLISRTKS